MNQIVFLTNIDLDSDKIFNCVYTENKQFDTFIEKYPEYSEVYKRMMEFEEQYKIYQNGYTNYEYKIVILNYNKNGTKYNYAMSEYEDVSFSISSYTSVIDLTSSEEIHDNMHELYKKYLMNLFDEVETFNKNNNTIELISDYLYIFKVLSYNYIEPIIHNKLNREFINKELQIFDKVIETKNVTDILLFHLYTNMKNNSNSVKIFTNKHEPNSMFIGNYNNQYLYYLNSDSIHHLFQLYMYNMLKLNTLYDSNIPCYCVVENEYYYIINDKD